MPPTYTCTVLGTCSGTTPQQIAQFKQLQSELNRVRKRYGLPADVTVDGKIGAGTLAKLIKLATKLVGDRNLGDKVDKAIEAFAVGIAGGTATSSPDFVGLPSTKMIAGNASAIIQALGRDGIDARWAWMGGPTGDWQNPATTPNPGVPSIPVGPTAPVPVLPILPYNATSVTPMTVSAGTLWSKIRKPVLIVGAASLGLTALAILGGVIAARR